MLTPELRHRHTGLGGDGQKIRYQDLEGIPNSGSIASPFIGYFTVTATGSKVITGVGFIPKLVQFFYTTQSGGSGVGAMTSLSQFAHDYMGSGSSSQTECIYLRDSGGTAVCRATRTSLDSDGFTINVTTNSGTNRVDYIAYP